MLSEAATREGTLAKELEAEKQLRENEGLNFADHVAVGLQEKLEACDRSRSTRFLTRLEIDSKKTS